MSWIVILEGQMRKPDLSLVTVYLASEGFTTLATDTPASTHYPGVLRNGIDVSWQASVQTMGGRDTTFNAGGIEVDDTAGELAAWPTYSIDRLLWSAYVLRRGDAFADRVLLCKMYGRRRPEAIDAFGYRLNFSDRSVLFERRLAYDDYPNTISNTQLRGRPKPVVLGRVFQAPVAQPETTGNVRFDVTNQAFGGVLEVRDGGAVRTPLTQWRADQEAAIHGFELLTARGGRVVANVEGNSELVSGVGDVLAGTGAFSSLAAWTVTTATGTVARSWNPAECSSGITLSGANLSALSTSVFGGAPYVSVLANRRLRGKFYWEVDFGFTTQARVGVARHPIDFDVDLADHDAWMWLPSNGLSAGEIKRNGVRLALLPEITGGIARLAFDSTTGQFWVGDSTGWLNGDPATGSGGEVTTGDVLPAVSLFYAGTATLVVAAPTYAVPATFLLLEETAFASSVSLSGGGCRIHSSGGAASISQLALTAGVDYLLSVDVLLAEDGAIDLVCDGVVLATLSTAGSYEFAFNAQASDIEVRVTSNDRCEITFDNLVIIQVSLTNSLTGMIYYLVGDCAGVADADIDAAAIASMQSAAPYLIGYAGDTGDEIRDVLTQTLDCWLGFGYFNRQDVFTVGRLVDASGDPVMIFAAADLLGRVEHQFSEAKGLSNTLLAQRNWDRFSDADLPSGMAGIERAMVTAEYRTVATATGSNPYSDRVGLKPGQRVGTAEPLETKGMSSLISDAADAQTEVDRRWGVVYGSAVHDYRWSVLVDPDDPAVLDVVLGDVTRVSSAVQPDMVEGANQVVLGIRYQFPDGIVTFSGLGPAPALA